MNYSIGVVTYHARFEKYFIPLIKKLTAIFPDKEIICVINGHPDRTLQINYLNNITAFLSKFSNVRYLTYDTNQSLSKCWNQIIILSQTEKVIIINDDTQVTDLFRQEFETKVLDIPFSIMNASWSHFLTSKEIVKKVGWFDERLLGVGYEDADYGLRMAMLGIPMTNTICLGLNNYVAGQENPGWKNISQKINASKYTLVNFEFFKTKWVTMDINPEIKPENFKHKLQWNDTLCLFSPKTNEPTPIFYDFSCLDYKIKTSFSSLPYIENNFKITMQKVFFAFKQLLKKIYRKML
ncbi:MAG: glycosyltransferase family A protein [Minisyncoccia bacterium]